MGRMKDFYMSIEEKVVDAIDLARCETLDEILAYVRTFYDVDRDTVAAVCDNWSQPDYQDAVDISIPS